MTITEYISTVTSFFNDKRIINKTQTFLKKNHTTQNNKVMDIK
jgi:hypothetical protein